MRLWVNAGAMSRRCRVWFSCSLVSSPSPSTGLRNTDSPSDLVNASDCVARMSCAIAGELIITTSKTPRRSRAAPGCERAVRSCTAVRLARNSIRWPMTGRPAMRGGGRVCMWVQDR